MYVLCVNLNWRDYARSDFSTLGKLSSKKLWLFGGMGELEKQSTGKWQHVREPRERERELGRKCWTSLLQTAALCRLAQHPLELYGNVGQIYHPGLTGQFSYLCATGIASESATIAVARRKPPPHSSNTLMPTDLGMRIQFALQSTVTSKNIRLQGLRTYQRLSKYNKVDTNGYRDSWSRGSFPAPFENKVKFIGHLAVLGKLRLIQIILIHL